ncbi:MAG: DUF4169 domain-containing protein [Oceanicaulis sp.]|nr:DUF4169 domain-containing protein [Oceanicaulis sp.]MBI75579.1 DUF4169 domain-containing protein [Oceanicaulis sp.]|tara:strand:- start:22 stop:204 length:183 start_codon:yes stop_codon:yes gene_type:complete
MTRPVNLRQYRKRKRREDKAAAAEVNRVKHGTPKAVSDLAKARAEMAAKTLDGHRRDDGE